MGIFTGYQMAKADKEAREDKQATRDLAERNMKLAEKQFSAAERDRALQWMSQYSEANNKRNVGAKEKAKMKAKLLSMELDGRTADYLIGSGEASGIIDVFNTRSKAGTISTEWIGSIVTKVDSLLDDKSSPQAKALAVKTALLSAADQSKEDGQYAALLEVSFNIMESGIVPGDFNENVARAIAGLNLPKPTIALTPIGNLTSGSKAIGSDETNKIRARIKDAITVHVGQIFSRDVGTGMPIGAIDPTKIKGPVDPIDIEELITTSVQGILNNLQSVSNVNPSDIIQAGYTSAMEGASALQKEAQKKLGDGNNNNRIKLPTDPAGGIGAAMGGNFNTDEKDQSAFDFIQKVERNK